MTNHIFQETYEIVHLSNHKALTLMQILRNLTYLIFN